MNSKKLRLIIIILIVINIITLFAIISVINKDKQESEANSNTIKYTGDTTNDGQERDGFVNVSSLYKNYKGSIPKSEIATKIETVITQYFPIMKKKVIDEKVDIDLYLSKNKDSIRNRFGITTVEDFSRLIGEIEKINCEVDDYKSYELLEDSFKEEGNYTKCTLLYKYSNGQEIELDFYILNKESETEVKYKFIPKN